MYINTVCISLVCYLLVYLHMAISQFVVFFVFVCLLVLCISVIYVCAYV